jgi:type II secretory pathway component PulM
MMRVTPEFAVDAWNRAGAREQLAAAAIAVAVVTAVAILWIVMPLHDAVGRVREDLTRERMLLEVARAHRAEDAGLAQVATPAQDTQGAADIDQVLAKHGLAPLSPARAGADGRIDVVIPDAAFAALVPALDDLARESGIRIAVATLLARVEPGSVRAELVLAR